MPRYRNCIFDLYGTLVDIETNERGRRLWRLSSLYYASHGAKYDPGELRRCYLSFCAEEQAKSPEPYYEIELRDVFRRLYQEKGARPDARLIDETARFFRFTSTKKLRLYPWVAPVFSLLRKEGVGVYLLSNAQACFTRPELEALGLTDAFNGVALSSDVGTRKPDPEIMMRLLDENGLNVRDCIMTGNDRTTDVAVARSVGMDCLFIQTETSGPYDPTLIADAELTDGDWTRIPRLLGLE